MYKVSFTDFAEHKNDLEHNAADYDQAKHFFVEMCNRLNKEEYKPAFDLIFYGAKGQVLARYQWN